MIKKWYEVSCDYCGKTIQHYPRKRPSADELRKDGAVPTRTKQFCSYECFADWQHDRQEKQYLNLRQHGKIHNERGWMVVYPIVDGCSQEALFEGTKEQCKRYVSIMKEKDPKADFIVVPL